MVTSICVSPWVTHERLDDEVIAINLETGAYFAFSGVAADCWSLIASSLPIDTVAATLSERYAVDEARVRDDVTAFAAQLAESGLTTVDATNAEPSEAPTLPSRAEPLSYAPPAIERYDDLQELLLLDPVHEVDEAGWPVAAAE